MARIPYFDREKATGRAAKVYETLPNLNIFRMLGHSGDMIEGFINWLGDDYRVPGPPVDPESIVGVENGVDSDR